MSAAEIGSLIVAPNLDPLKMNGEDQPQHAQPQQQDKSDLDLSMATTAATQFEPDLDAIKMFVGQIPRHWNEPECRKLFEAFGPVYSCNILREKPTQISKGCCFVTYFHRKDAIEAQGALHNIKTIDGMHHPIQMKPADAENRNERKLFIGQLSKKHDEEDLRQIFSKFGQIEDASVLRDADGKSKGCAFVTFINRSCAMIATKEMHHSQTMEGCAAPLVVKFADTQKDKDVKTSKNGSIQNSSGSPGLLGALNPGLLQQLGGAAGGQNIQAVASLLSLLGAGGQQGGAAINQQGNVLGLLGSAHQFIPQQPTHLDALMAQQIAQQNQILALQGFAVQQQQQQQQQQQSVQHQAAFPHRSYSSIGGSPDSSSNSSTSGTNMNGTDDWYLYQQQQQKLAVAQAVAQQQQVNNSLAILNAAYGYPGGLAGAKTTSPVAATLPPHTSLTLAPYPGAVIDPYQAAAAAALHQQQNPYALLANLQTANTVAAAAANSIVGNGDVKGPDGSNLFIYHLPQDFGDADLLNTFAPFGSVLSAKVFIDKVTNLSKCFGFVSFDNPTSAANAIQAMNGFQIGSKRLKVQLKVDRGNPYNR
ncbi:unnamed protein product [Caenorhabditis angaria]|uniref:RRM domain-containing protein n=1 Tax=Caenorhabditis angaria TaxID=860376 RepID=A0A9P1I810_9PELO|nr:unnamed protein product [Caenorhabditis angaria]